MQTRSLPWVGYWVAKYGADDGRVPLWVRTCVRVTGGQVHGFASQADAPLVQMLAAGLRVTLGERRAHVRRVAP